MVVWGSQIQRTRASCSLLCWEWRGTEIKKKRRPRGRTTQMWKFRFSSILHEWNGKVNLALCQYNKTIITQMFVFLIWQQHPSKNTRKRLVSIRLLTHLQFGQAFSIGIELKQPMLKCVFLWMNIFYFTPCIYFSHYAIILKIISDIVTHTQTVWLCGSLYTWP